ncbi:hypothetical protein [Dongia sp.]|uniref:hypothetical protein n=1 Tax=Dongia sp. TaxID=1977262 RepID=UPI0035ADBDE6
MTHQRKMRAGLLAFLALLLLLAARPAAAEEFTWEIRVLNATEIDLSGGIGKGIAAEFAAVLEANPGLRLVHVNVGRGGLLKEAWAIADQIAQRKMDTYVPQPCAAACTIVVSGGVNRYLRKGAKLGYANYEIPEKGPMTAEQWQTLYKTVFPADFVAEALEARPDALWAPKPDELLAAGAITEIVSGDSFAASGLASGAADIEADLLDQRIFRVLKVREPEHFAKLVDKLQRGAAQGVPAEELRRAGLEWTSALRARYVPYAEDGAVLAYFHHVLVEVENVAATSKSGCVALLSGGQVAGAEKAIHLIPEELRRQESELMADVFETADPARPLPETARTDALFETVLTRMGPDAGLLDHVAEPDFDAETGCRVMVSLYRETLALPPADSAALLKSWYLQ